MAFEIGEIVTPIVNLTYSGVELPTYGVSGTVLERQITGSDTENNLLYDYKVQLFENIIVEDIDYRNIFMFSDIDLGAIIVVTGPYDAGLINQNFYSTLNLSEQTKNNTRATADRTNTSSSFYDSLDNIANVVDQQHSTFAARSTIDTSASTGDQNRMALELDSISSGVNINSLILQEISDNLYGYYTIVESMDTELQTIEKQTNDQYSKYLDDLSNLSNIYFQSVVLQNQENIYPSNADSFNDLVTSDSLVLEVDEE